MRIIAGKYKGKTLFSPKNNLTRPTSSRLRETLFNILQGRIENSIFLELFAGSGAIGFEALSRNASEVYLVENDPSAISCIKKNIDTLEVSSQAQLLSLDVLQALRLLSKKKIEFDLIYADPPYCMPIHNELISISTLSLIDSSKILKKGGLCFMEEGIELPVEKLNFENIKLSKVKKQGRAFLHQFERIT